MPLAQRCMHQWVRTGRWLRAILSTILSISVSCLLWDSKLVRKPADWVLLEAVDSISPFGDPSKYFVVISYILYWLNRPFTFTNCRSSVRISRISVIIHELGLFAHRFDFVGPRHSLTNFWQTLPRRIFLLWSTVEMTTPSYIIGRTKVRFHPSFYSTGLKTVIPLVVQISCYPGK